MIWATGKSSTQFIEVAGINHAPVSTKTIQGKQCHRLMYVDKSQRLVSGGKVHHHRVNLGSSYGYFGAVSNCFDEYKPIKSQPWITL